MPDPRSDPAFKSQGSDLPKGSASALDEGLDIAASAPDVPQEVEAQFSTSLDDLAANIETEADETDEYSEAFFGPTDFPQRPLTHGASFGPGSNAVRGPKLSDRAYLQRIATRMVERKDDMPDDALVWALRVLTEE